MGMPNVLIWKGSSECCDNLDQLSILIANIFTSVQLDMGLVHLKDLRARNEASYPNIARHWAVIMWPYENFQMSFFELFHAAVPMFLPDQFLLGAYAYRGA